MSGGVTREAQAQSLAPVEMLILPGANDPPQA